MKRLQAVLAAAAISGFLIAAMLLIGLEAMQRI
jgi:hypothetical protein